MIHEFLALFTPRLFWNWNSYVMTSQEQVYRLTTITGGKAAEKNPF